MMKKLLSITAVFLLALSATAVGQVKIGYMNTQEVLNQLPQREQVQKELESYIQKKQERLSQEATKFQDAVGDYQNSRGAMSQQQIEAREQKLEEMQTSLDELNQSIRRDIQQKRQELLEPIFRQIDNAISTIAEERNLDFVLNKATNSGNTILFYASPNQTDITQGVINHISSNSEN